MDKDLAERYPKISIVTPSFNQGKYLEKTILSVIEQGYPNLEYIIIDGGSTDESVKIIRKYEQSLSYRASEPDRGQSHAINKGFGRATGRLLFSEGCSMLLHVSSRIACGVATGVNFNSALPSWKKCWHRGDFYASGKATH